MTIAILAIAFAILAIAFAILAIAIAIFEITYDALRVALTHPTGLSRLKCGIIPLLWDGQDAYPVRARCPHHKIYFYCTILGLTRYYKFKIYCCNDELLAGDRTTSAGSWAFGESKDCIMMRDKVFRESVVL